MLTFTAGTEEIGSTIQADTGDIISVRAEVHSRFPVDRIEIIQDGKVVAFLANVNGARDLAYETEVTVERSSWIAARAYSSRLLPYNNVPVMAHTSPIYLDVQGRPRRSAADSEFLAQWTDEEMAAELPAILRGLGVRRMVVGHTQARDLLIRSRSDGSVFLIDTGLLSSYYEGGRGRQFRLRDRRIGRREQGRPRRLRDRRAADRCRSGVGLHS